MGCWSSNLLFSREETTTVKRVLESLVLCVIYLRIPWSLNGIKKVRGTKLIHSHSRF